MDYENEYLRLTGEVVKASTGRQALIDDFAKTDRSEPLRADDPIFAEWTAADERVAEAREALRTFFGRLRWRTLRKRMP